MPTASPPSTAPAAGAADRGVPPPEGCDSYEKAVAELETLVARMESGNLSLEESLAAYRRGSTLVDYCQQQLEKVEQQVRVLDGEILKPFDAGTAGEDAA